MRTSYYSIHMRILFFWLAFWLSCCHAAGAGSSASGAYSRRHRRHRRFLLSHQAQDQDQFISPTHHHWSQRQQAWRRLWRFHQMQHDSQYYYSMMRGGAAASTTPSAPWRRQQQRQYQQQVYRSTVDDHSRHFLDADEWVDDRRARIWSKQSVKRQSWARRLLVGNVVMFALQTAFPVITSWGIQIPTNIFQLGEWYRLLTPVVLHGGLAHLMMNSYSLMNVAPSVEELFGSGRFLATYLAAGVAGNYLSAIQTPNPSLGASGAIFGIVGAAIVFTNRHEWIMGRAAEAMNEGLIFSVGANLVFGAISPQIDNWGHLGGLIGGAAFAYYFGPRLFLGELPVTEGQDAFTAAGGRNNRVIVDRPILRLPRPIESIPENISTASQRLMHMAGSIGLGGGGGNRPWQRGRQQLQQQQQQLRQRRYNTPSRSIKPGKV